MLISFMIIHSFSCACFDAAARGLQQDIGRGAVAGVPEGAEPQFEGARLIWPQLAVAGQGVMYISLAVAQPLRDVWLAAAAAPRRLRGGACMCSTGTVGDRRRGKATRAEPSAERLAWAACGSPRCPWCEDQDCLAP